MSAARSLGRDGADIESFLEMMAVERGAADNTIAAYRRDLEDASGFLAGQGVSLGKASAEHLRGFVSHLATQGFAPSSQARRSPPRRLPSTTNAVPHSQPSRRSASARPSTRRRPPAPRRHPTGTLCGARPGSRVLASSTTR